MGAASAVELLGQLASSEDFSRCFSDQWLRYVLGRRLLPSDAATPSTIHDAFKGAGLNVKELLVRVVSSQAFSHRSVTEGEVVQ